LIIKRRSNALIVGRNGTRSEHRPVVALAMVHFGDGVGLHQVLVSVSDVLNDAKVRLQDRVPVPERGIEFELVAQGRFARDHIAAKSHVNLIEHVFIEVVLVWADAGLFVGIHAQRGNKALHSVSILHERVNVRGVCCRIASDQRRVHVTGGLRHSD